MNKKSFVFFIISLIIPFSAFSFWSLPVDLYDHSKITRNGLSEYKYNLVSSLYDENAYCSSNGCKFTSTVKTIIAKANESMDDGNTDEPIYHCDNEEIKHCSRLVYTGANEIIGRLSSIVSSAEEGDETTVRADYPELKKIYKILGKKYHTLQDFYSHSNWIEREIYGKQGKIRIDEDFTEGSGAINVNKDFFTKRRYNIQKSTGSTCVTGPSWEENKSVKPYKEIYLDQLVTGYYEESNDLYRPFKQENIDFGDTRVISLKDYDYKYCNTPGAISNNKCIIDGEERPLGYAGKMKILARGLLLDISVGKSYDGPYFSNGDEKCIHSESIVVSKPKYIGIAKDHVTSIHHTDAAAVAVRATHEYIKYIINGVLERSGKSPYTDWVILKFLGHYPKFPEVPSDSSQSLKVFAKSGADYQIWGGNTLYSSEQNYNIDQQSDYSLLANASNGGVNTVTQQYPYYVIAVKSIVEVDAIQIGNETIYLEQNNHDWGNVDSHLSPSYDDMGLNLLGSPDNIYSKVGLEGGSGSGGNYNGFIVITNPN